MAFTERYVTQAAGGGGAGTEGDPWTFAEGVSNYIAGDRVNVKADSTYSLGAQTLSTAATDSALVHWRGYTTTIGDGGKAVLTLSGVFTLSGTGITLESLAMTATHVGRVLTSGGGNLMKSCDFTQNGNGYGVDTQHGDVMWQCRVDVSNTTSTSRYGIGVEFSSIRFCAVETQAGTAIDFRSSSRDYHIEGCTIFGDGTAGSIGIDIPTLDPSTGRYARIYSNSIYNVDDGISVVNGPDAADTEGVMEICNNVIYTVDNGIINTTGTKNARIFLSNNFIGNATTARYSGLSDAVLHGDVTLTADPFTNAATNDFTLNETAGGGALVRDAGLEALDPL